MYNSVKRTVLLLARTPLIPPAPAPPTFELAPMSSGPSRPSMGRLRTLSGMSVNAPYGYSMQMERRGYASDHGKKELYSDEAGSTGAGTDDVAHSDAAFNKDPDPSTSAKQVENETGKDFTSKSPAHEEYSKPPKQGGKHNDTPMGTSDKPEGR